MSSKKNAINIKKVPRMKQISEILRIPAPTPETVDLKTRNLQCNHFLMSKFNTNTTKTILKFKIQIYLRQ